MASESVEAASHVRSTPPSRDEPDEAASARTPAPDEQRAPPERLAIRSRRAPRTAHLTITDNIGYSPRPGTSCPLIPPSSPARCRVALRSVVAPATGRSWGWSWRIGRAERA